MPLGKDARTVPLIFLQKKLILYGLFIELDGFNGVSKVDIILTVRDP